MTHAEKWLNLNLYRNLLTEVGFDDAVAEDVEGAEDLDPEEEEELEEDVDEAKQSSSKMQEVINILKEINVTAWC